MPETAPPPEYLGDGVYASFDGYQIWLHLGDHRSKGLIAIEAPVMNALRRYAGRCWFTPNPDRIPND